MFFQTSTGRSVFWNVFFPLSRNVCLLCAFNLTIEIIKSKSFSQVINTPCDFWYLSKDLVIFQIPLLLILIPLPTSWSGEHTFISQLLDSNFMLKSNLSHQVVMENTTCRRLVNMTKLSLEKLKHEQLTNKSCALKPCNPV